MSKPFLIIIFAIIGAAALGNAAYFGVKEYGDYVEEKAQQASLNEIVINRIHELEKKILSLEDEKDTYAQEQSEESDMLQNEIKALRQKDTELQKKNVELQKNQESLKIATNADIVEKVKPAIVYISTEDNAGSGFIINSTGNIITNSHVVEGVNTVSVKLSDGRSFVGIVAGRNEKADIALIKIGISNLEYIKLGDSDSSELKQGDRVITFGYPFGLQGEVSIKEGTISRRLHDGDTTYLETSAEIHPGNSGGPLVNSDGVVVGVSVATLGKLIDGVSIGETIKLAIPINTVKGLISTL